MNWRKYSNEYTALYLNVLIGIAHKPENMEVGCHVGLRRGVETDFMISDYARF
jgi:hypothetical protein